MAGGGRALARDMSPPHNTGQLLWQTALCGGGGGGGRGEQLIKIIKARHKKHAPPITSLSQYCCKSDAK